ncbi:MAG: hypothetical protein WC894_03300 [Patescibacteria group bacterium]
MVKKSKRISRPVKQKFSPGFFYLVFSLIVLILITFFINTSKISKEPKAARRLVRRNLYTNSYPLTVSECKDKNKNYVDVDAGWQDPTTTATSGCNSGYKSLGTYKHSYEQYLAKYNNDKLKALKFMATDYETRCCISNKGYAIKQTKDQDKFCSSITMYNSDKKKIIGKLDMKCKPNCVNASLTDKNNQFNEQTMSGFFAKVALVCLANKDIGNFEQVSGNCCYRSGDWPK